MSRTITLPCYGITVTLEPGIGNSTGGAIASLLAEDPNDQDNIAFNAAIDGIEAMILACACEGIDIESPAFIAAIETAVEAAANNL